MRPDANAWLRSVEPTPDGFVAVLVYPPEACEGHFPGYPLVPAVYLIEGVRAAAERAAGRPLRLARVSDAKFSAEVKPGDEVVVEATLDGTRCDARLTGGTRIRIEVA